MVRFLSNDRGSDMRTHHQVFRLDKTIYKVKRFFSRGSLFMGAHPGQGLHVDGLRAGFSERLGAFIDRRTRGEHVIDEQRGFSLDRGRGRHGKASSKIFQPLPSREGRLGSGRLCPPERVDENGKIPLSAQMVGQQERLIIFPFPEAVGVQRDGDQDIDVRGGRVGLGDQSGQGRGQLSLAPVLQEPDGFLQWGLVGIGRPDPVIGRRAFSTWSAQVFGTMSQRVRRRKGLRTARATRRTDGLNPVPAALAKKGNRVVLQGIVARPTIHGKHHVEESAKQSGGHVFPRSGP